MAIDKGVWRPVYIDDWDWLEDCSPLAQRLWFWLSASKQSTATGLQRVRQHAAVGVLRTKPTAYSAALAELEDAGRVLVQSRGDGWVDLYLTLWVRRQCSVRDTQRAAIRRLIDRFVDGAAKSQAIEDWTVWDSACAKADRSLTAGKAQPEPQQEQDQEQDQEQKTSLSTPLPTVAAPTGAKVAKESKPKRATFSEPTEAETLAIVVSLVPTLQAFRQERIATACFSYWQSAGWRRKNGPIRDWPATVRTWVTNQADRDKDVSVALASKPVAPPPAPVEKVWPFYAVDGTGLDAPEYSDPKWGPTSMTEAGWKKFNDSLPF